MTDAQLCLQWWLSNERLLIDHAMYLVASGQRGAYAALRIECQARNINLDQELEDFIAKESNRRVG